jgi:hypothetical protein
MYRVVRVPDSTRHNSAPENGHPKHGVSVTSARTDEYFGGEDRNTFTKDPQDRPIGPSAMMRKAKVNPHSSHPSSYGGWLNSPRAV